MPETPFDLDNSPVSQDYDSEQPAKRSLTIEDYAKEARDIIDQLAIMANQSRNRVQIQEARIEELEMELDDKEQKQNDAVETMRRRVFIEDFLFDIGLHPDIAVRLSLGHRNDIRDAIAHIVTPVGSVN